MIKNYIRNTSSFDSHLFVGSNNATTNVRFFIRLRVFLKQGAVGATAAPGGKNSKAFATTKQWEDLRKNFKKDSEAFWSGKYWLAPKVPYTELQHGPTPSQNKTYQCNAYCELILDVVDSDADAHRTVNIYNVDGADEDSFPTDSANFSAGDIKEKHTFPDGLGGTCTQRTLFHESGHLLGLNHVGVYKSTTFTDSAGVNHTCVVANQNTQPGNVCYKGPTKADTCSIMGLGIGISVLEGRVWHERIPQHTNIPQANWQLSRQRIAPKAV